MIMFLAEFWENVGWIVIGQMFKLFSAALSVNNLSFLTNGKPKIYDNDVTNPSRLEPTPPYLHAATTPLCQSRSCNILTNLLSQKYDELHF